MSNNLKLNLKYPLQSPDSTHFVDQENRLIPHVNQVLAWVISNSNFSSEINQDPQNQPTAISVILTSFYLSLTGKEKSVVVIMKKTLAE